MELLKKLGRPRIGTWRCGVTMPDGITERIDAWRRLSNEDRNAAVVKLVEHGLDMDSVYGVWRMMELKDALRLMNDALRYRMSNAQKPDEKRRVLRALAQLEGLTEYFKEENGK